MSPKNLSQAPSDESIIPLKSVYLHAAIIIGGETLNFLEMKPGNRVQRLEWTPSGMLYIERLALKDNVVHRHLLPAAAVKDSVLL